MRKLPNKTLLPLARISPSQVTNLRACAGQVLLRQAYRDVKLVPPSPAAVFGTAIHRLFELARNQAFANRVAIKEELAHQIRLAEEKLQTEGYAHLTPLRYRIRNFATKCALTIDRAEALLNKKWSGTGVETITRTEQWLLSKDEQMGGIIDAIIQRGDHVQLLDYKSGNIFEDPRSGQLKETYEEQLKLYAQLYFDNYGFYPKQLTILDLHGYSIDVDFSEEGCQTIYDQSIADLRRVNTTLVTDPLSLFTPAPPLCQWCEVRAVCDHYSPEIKVIGQSTDIVGTLTDVISRPRGLVVVVELPTMPITIVGIPATSGSDWQRLVGQQVRLFGIKFIAESRYEWQTETTGWY